MLVWRLLLILIFMNTALFHRPYNLNTVMLQKTVKFSKDFCTQNDNFQISQTPIISSRSFPSFLVKLKTKCSTQHSRLQLRFSESENVGRW